MYKLAFFLIILTLSFPQLIAKEELKEQDLNPVCVDFKGWSPLSAFQSTLTFYSQCYMPMYISACVKERYGEWKLYKSTARVGSYGWWKLNIDSSREPKELEFSYDHFAPPVPEPCQKKDA